MEISVPKFFPVDRVELIHWDTGQVQVNRTYLNCDIPIGGIILQEVNQELHLMKKIYHISGEQLSVYRSEGVL